MPPLHMVFAFTLLILGVSNVVYAAVASLHGTGLVNSTDLECRQCVKNQQTGQYRCDYNLPSVGQTVARCRDTNDRGRVAPENVPWFYTHLWSAHDLPTDQESVAETAELAKRDEVRERAPSTAQIQTIESTQLFETPQASRIFSPNHADSNDTSAGVTPFRFHSDPGHAKELHPRQCLERAQPGVWDCDFAFPTLQQFIDRYRDYANWGMATPGRSVWFYTNLDQTNDATVFPNCYGWLLMNNIDSYYGNSGLSSLWLAAQVEWIEDHRAEFLAVTGGQDPMKVFSVCLFEALALSTLNPDAYVFTKAPPETWRDTSWWALIEYPALTNNPIVQRIWRVDPRPGQCNDRILIWQRGRDLPLQMFQSCQVLEQLRAPNPAATAKV
ncbi:hypothetical protein PV08_02103 [Exophiala spinifera]|uniref:ADP-ribosyl cyclase/cyclic ADP-ribose hydrolase n=1 Tax=Exophiala spinifera TaxID=91928 RepID=A0A0D2BR87_9EURO|nr:uncharacterized protein PV08_02103 [Exophiala spinifera]KIW21523.1 hypothetical protein PV08_02103 [Exophiala spinifera]